MLREFSPLSWDVRYLILGLIGAGIIISGHNEVQQLISALEPFGTPLRKAILTKLHGCERLDNIQARVMSKYWDTMRTLVLIPARRGEKEM